MSLLLLFPSLALATEPVAPVAPTTEAAKSHITVVRQVTASVLPDATNFVVAITCQPAKPSKFDYFLPAIADYTSENAAFIAATSARSDIHLVVDVKNATPAETIAWFKALDEQFEEPMRELIVTISCPAWGGETDEERILMNGGSLSFVDLLTAAKPIAKSSIWILDASRNVSGALDETVMSYGPTADDVVKYGIVPDAFAVSSSVPSKFGGPGLIGAVAKVIAESKGGGLDLEAFYYRGVKPAVPTHELFTSMGVMEPDTWNGNLARPILPGGPLIVPIGEVEPPVARKKVPAGCWVAGAGALLLIPTGIMAGEAAVDYRWLDDVNNGTIITTTPELQGRVDSYKVKMGVTVGFGALSVLAMAGGTTWTILEVNGREVEIVPTGTGAEIRGKF